MCSSDLFPSHDIFQECHVLLLSYIDLASWLDVMYKHSLSAVDAYISSNKSVSSRSATGFQAFCAKSSTYSDVFICDGYRYCRAAKLLMALVYGNFDSVIQYDIFSMALKYCEIAADACSTI